MFCGGDLPVSGLGYPRVSGLASSKEPAHCCLLWKLFSLASLATTVCRTLLLVGNVLVSPKFWGGKPRKDADQDYCFQGCCYIFWMGDQSLTSTRLYSTLLNLKLSQDLWMTNHQLTVTSCGFKNLHPNAVVGLCLKPLTTAAIFGQGWKAVIFWNSLAFPTGALASSLPIHQRHCCVSVDGSSCSSLLCHGGAAVWDTFAAFVWC